MEIKERAQKLIDEHGKTEAIRICNQFLVDGGLIYCEWIKWKVILREIESI